MNVHSIVGTVVHSTVEMVLNHEMCTVWMQHEMPMV
jgi:hypothetical protein